MPHSSTEKYVYVAENKTNYLKAFVYFLPAEIIQILSQGFYYVAYGQGLYAAFANIWNSFCKSPELQSEQQAFCNHEDSSFPSSHEEWDAPMYLVFVAIAIGFSLFQSLIKLALLKANTVVALRLEDYAEPNYTNICCTQSSILIACSFLHTGAYLILSQSDLIFREALRHAEKTACRSIGQQMTVNPYEVTTAISIDRLFMLSILTLILSLAINAIIFLRLAYNNSLDLILDLSTSRNSNRQQTVRGARPATEKTPLLPHPSIQETGFDNWTTRTRKGHQTPRLSS